MQREISRPVAKRGWIEMDDIGCTAQVFAVAGFTVNGVGIFKAAVEPLPTGDILVDFIMAVQAQAAL